MATSPSDDEDRVEHKRMVHNEVERRRKVKINNWIYRLGDLLPGCSDDKKISKNGILERAVVYLKELQENNDKLLHGHCTEVQVAEFQRMKDRIQELELRNSELTRIVESSGISVDLDGLWQQRGKYSQKIEPENVAGMFSCGKVNVSVNCTDKKAKPLLPKSLDVKLAACGKSPVVRSSVNNELLLQQSATTLQSCGSSRPELVAVCSGNRSLPITLQVDSKPSNNLECNPVSLAPSNSVTAVTQALPSVPIMSTSQHSTGNQQLLQQLPVLNYGNTVNIFPGLSGQSQPMIIINEQGIPFLQNLVPGQMILQQGSNQSVALSSNGSIPHSTILPAKNANNIVTVTNDLNNGGNGTLLLSTLQPSPALSTGIGSSQIIVNAGIGQSLLPTTVSNQTGGQLMLNPTLSHTLFPTSVAVTCTGLVNNCHVAVPSSSSSNEMPGMRSAMLPATNSQAFFQSPAINSATHILPASATSQVVNKMDSTQLANSLLGKGTINSQIVFGCSPTASLPPLQLAVPHASTLIMRNGSKQMVQSPSSLLSQESGFPAQLLSQSCIPVQPNPVHIVPQQTTGLSSGGQTIPVNNNPPTSLPSALLLPNGQIIPVVSQPSLLYPASTPVNGSLLVTSSSPTAVFQSANGTNTQQFKPIISKEAVKGNSVPHGCMRQANVPIGGGSTVHKTDTQNKTSNTILLQNPSETCTSATTTVEQGSIKKSVRKCHRTIKPKPSSPAMDRCLEINADTVNIVVNDVASETAAAGNDGTKSKAEMESTVPSGSVTTSCIASTNASVTKSFIHTDILAKATESIFANSVSEPSPATSLYSCESSSFCCRGNETMSNCEQSSNVKSLEVLDSFGRDAGSSETKGNLDVPSNDIFSDLEHVYENVEKDMPTLEPVSPLEKAMVSGSSVSTTNEESNHEKHAPQLSLMITDHQPSNELEMTSKRNETLKSCTTPNKRQKLEIKLDSVTCSKESVISLPPATQSLNFLSISQLTNSNFAMENNLSNENSPLSSISPLLASPAKSLNSETYIPTAVCQHPGSVSSMTISPSVPQMNNAPDPGTHEIESILGPCEGALTKAGMGSDDMLPIKAPSAVSCSMKLAMKGNNQVTASMVPPATTEVQINSTSTFNHPTQQLSYTQSTASLASISQAPQSTQQSGRMMQGSCLSLAHFPPINQNASVQDVTMLPSLNVQNSLYGSASVSSSEATGLTHSLTTSSNSFPCGTLSAAEPSAANERIGTAQQQQQTTPTGDNLNVTNSLHTNSFAMPDLIQGNGNSKNQTAFGNISVNLTPTMCQDGQCPTDSSENANDLVSGVPSFNFGLFSQQQPSAVGSQPTPQLLGQTSRPFAQAPFQQQGAAMMMMTSQISASNLDIGKMKSTLPVQRSANADTILQTVAITPIQGANVGHMGGMCHPPNHSTTTNVTASQQGLLTNTDTLPFSMHRVSSTTSNYSAESLIGQVAYTTHKQTVPQSSRPCLSYSAESLIQSQTDRNSQCPQNGLSHHSAGVISLNATTSSFPNAANPMPVPYSTSKRFNINQSCSVTNFHSTTNHKSTPCSHVHQHGNLPFSFSLSQTNNQTTSNVQQPHLTTAAYPNMLPHYSANFSSRGTKQSSAGQTPPVFRQDGQEGSVVMQTQNCSGYSLNSFNPFPGANRAPISATNTANLAEPNKLAVQEKNKSKQENHINKSSVKPSKHSVQNKQKKGYSVEEVNLSNSIFETNRSVTPCFTIPNLSPPRNEAPTYLATPNLFSSSQRPTIGASATQQNKTTTDVRTGYDPLFTSRSQTGLNLNFQPPSFGVNHIHNASSTVNNPITNHNNVTNFNLSNIFPDINATSDNLSPMKFHSTNSVLPNDMQHHQTSALYNRPMLPNGMSINSFLTHNPHGFDSRPPVAMPPINNSVPPAFHGHSHTPSFSNVIPTLNFPMHEH